MHMYTVTHVLWIFHWKEVFPYLSTEFNLMWHRYKVSRLKNTLGQEDREYGQPGWVLLLGLRPICYSPVMRQRNIYYKLDSVFTLPPILHATQCSNAAEKGDVLIAAISGFSGNKGPALKGGALPASMKQLSIYLWVVSVACNLFIFKVLSFSLLYCVCRIDKRKVQDWLAVPTTLAQLPSLLIVSFYPIC